MLSCLRVRYATDKIVTPKLLKLFDEEGRHLSYLLTLPKLNRLLELPDLSMLSDSRSSRERALSYALIAESTPPNKTSVLSRVRSRRAGEWISVNDLRFDTLVLVMPHFAGSNAAFPWDLPPINHPSWNWNSHCVTPIRRNELDICYPMGEMDPQVVSGSTVPLTRLNLE